MRIVGVELRVQDLVETLIEIAPDNAFGLQGCSIQCRETNMGGIDFEMSTDFDRKLVVIHFSTESEVEGLILGVFGITGNELNRNAIEQIIIEFSCTRESS